MLSVIIATRDSERPLVATLAALVPGAVAGLIGEVLIADGGSRDDTAAVADIAGCRFLALAGASGQRLRSATAQARGPWLLFVRPGTVLDAPWTAAARRFIERAAPAQDAAVFRSGGAAQAPLRDAVALVADALGRLPHPRQGLLIGKDLYDALGGHPPELDEPERQLLRRIGRHRLRRLGAAAYAADT